ncbi:GDT1-like protein [Ceratobasidium sp. AG-Ba]|nr:GDT1-like protein [Ceratobasidium sp. AG-Ba]QRV91758.1 GDT1-like protein [Ceratobasidium sp. AG-Ba]
MAPIPAVPSDDNVHALSSAFLMIIASEIGDKTFLIAAIMAMRHPRLIVFSGAFGSLIVMSALSAAMGHLLPTLISRRWTTLAAAGLFLVFGVKMLLEAREMEAGQDKIQEELKEVEEELDAAEGSIPMRHMEQGERSEQDAEPLTPAPKNASLSEGAKNLFGMCLGPVFVQTFILTFLGEWGDRSQIATIALGAAHNVYIVTIGTIIGHALCTGIAVLGGRWLSTKISIKHVTLTGSILFLLFAVVYFYESWTFVPDVPSLDLDMPMKAVERM